MNETRELRERIDTLEMRIAHQDEALDSLNRTVAEQWTQIDALSRQIVNLNDRIQAAENNPATPASSDPPPPHY